MKIYNSGSEAIKSDIRFIFMSQFYFYKKNREQKRDTEIKLSLCKFQEYTSTITIFWL